MPGAPWDHLLSQDNLQDQNDLLTQLGHPIVPFLIQALGHSKTGLSTQEDLRERGARELRGLLIKNRDQKLRRLRVS